LPFSLAFPRFLIIFILSVFSHTSPLFVFFLCLFLQSSACFLNPFVHLILPFTFCVLLIPSPVL
jgi:hypothetical protein